MQADTWLFRCDASPQLGLGHLMRCACLASALHQLNQFTVMVGPRHAYANMVAKGTFDAWFDADFSENVELDAQNLLKLARKFPVRGLVLDDYRINQAYQDTIEAAKLDWLQFDGKADQVYKSRWLLNTSPAFDESNYRGLMTKPDAELLLGPKFALLRPEFVHAHSHDKKAAVPTILVSMGGGDDHGALRFAVETILSCLQPPFHIHAISSGHNPRNQANREWITSLDPRLVTLWVDPHSVAELMAQSDMAVMAAGTTCYEANCMGLPMILVAIASNQIAHAHAWVEQSNATFAGVWPALGKPVLQKMVKSTLSCRDGQRFSIRRLVDGHGAQRVAARLCQTQI